MKHFIIKTVAGIITATVAVYVGGVYATGRVIDDYLEKIDENVAASAQIQKLMPGLSMKYELTENRFFSQSGVVTCSYKDNEIKVPVKISKGFLKAGTKFDTREVNELIGKDVLLRLDPKSIDARASFNIAFMATSYNFLFSLNGNYLVDPAKTVKFDFSVMADDGENIVTDAKFRNLILPGMVIADEIDLASSFKGFDKIKDFSQASVRVKNIRSNRFVKDDFEIATTAVNKDKDGNFDLNITARGDEIVGYLKNYDLDMTLSRLNIDKLNAVSAQNATEKDRDALLSGLNSAEITRFNTRAGQIVGFFTGIMDIEKMEFKSQGHFDWKYEDGFDSAKGKLVITTDSNQGAERIFVEHDGKYEAQISLENNKFFLNGQQFM